MKGTVLGLIKDMKYYFCQESVNMAALKTPFPLWLTLWRLRIFFENTGCKRCLAVTGS